MPLYRPALTSDEAGEVQLVADLIAKGVAGIAISPSNAPAMAAMLKEKKPQMPIMTIDADLQPEDPVCARPISAPRTIRWAC